LKILVVSLYFPPEMGAPAGRFYDFAQHWLKAGHEVTVVTGFPNFPAGIIHEGYRGKLSQRELIDGVDVRRCWILTAKSRFLSRALTYASFLLSSTLRVLFMRRQFDVVIATSPPPTVGLPGIVAAWRQRAPLIFDIRDIWPEAIVQSGRLKNPLIIALFEGTARLIYRVSTKIAVVTDGWRGRLIEIDVPGDKVEVLPNGVDVAAFDRDAEGELPAAFSVLDPDAHWFTYAGIFNRPQGLEVILGAAKHLREVAPELYQKSQFVMIGEGPTGDELREQAARDRLDRVVFIDRQPRAAVFAALRRSFANIVSLRPRKDTSTVPSKIYECMASGRPLLFSAAGEGGDTIRRAGAGAVTPPADAHALAEAMRGYLEDPASAERDGVSGRAFVVENFDRGKISLAFADLMERAARER
jgi:glycosyltransferase involved in cell wall biosynthesis